MSGTRQKTLGEQLSQTLVAEGRGEALDAEAEDAEPLMAKPASESPALAEQLMEEVCDRGNLERAWKRVRSNKGSPGVDGMTIDAAKDYLREHWPNIRAQLLEGTYQPQPVKRVEIPKPDGGIRKLGVPCVVDRLIQQAMLQVLQERWDPTFSEHSYGFRPGRSAHQAAKHRLVRLVRQTRPRARQPGMIGNLLAVRQPQEIAQRERVRATPRDAPLTVDALEIADHVHPEIAPRRQRRRADPRRVVRLAHVLHERVEPGLPKQLLQPIIEGVPRRARHLRPRRHQVALNSVRSPHRHR